MSDPGQGSLDVFGSQTELDTLDQFAAESPFGDILDPVDVAGVFYRRATHGTEPASSMGRRAGGHLAGRPLGGPALLVPARDADPDTGSPAETVWDATRSGYVAGCWSAGCRSGQHRADPLQQWARDARNAAASPDSEFEQFLSSDFEAARRRVLARAPL